MIKMTQSEIDNKLKALKELGIHGKDPADYFRENFIDEVNIDELEAINVDTAEILAFLAEHRMPYGSFKDFHVTRLIDKLPDGCIKQSLDREWSNFPTGELQLAAQLICLQYQISWPAPLALLKSQFPEIVAPEDRITIFSDRERMRIAPCEL
jgi:hypothetical protein